VDTGGEDVGEMERVMGIETNGIQSHTGLRDKKEQQNTFLQLKNSQE